MIIALTPVVVTVFAAVFLREIPTRAQVGFVLLSVAGVGLAVCASLGNASGGGQVIGILLLLVAVFSDASYHILARNTVSGFPRWI